MKITSKLFLAIFSLTAIVLVATLSLARWSFQQGFLDYINALEQQRLAQIAQSLVNHYQHNAKQLIAIDQQSFRQLLRNHAPHQAAMPVPPPRRGEPAKPHFLPRIVDNFPPQGMAKPPVLPATALVSATGEYLVGNKAVLTAEQVIRYPVMINQQKVAELWSEPKRQFESVQATEFAKQQQNTSILIGLCFLALAALVALMLAKRLVSPLKQAIAAIKQLSDGNYQLALLAKRDDELGQLTQDIQRLAHTLEQTQQAKNRWLANISHELRTPLTILMGELEMIDAGIRQFDQAQRQSFTQEVTRLMHLVDDLYQLSLADIGGLRYQFESVNLTDCIQQAITTTQTKQIAHQLTITTELLPDIMLLADPQRLTQLFINLIVNSCYYTDAPGRLNISMYQHNSKISLHFADSAPGVPDEALAQLFDSLYRQDQARTRAKAGAGLGLTICKTIVEGHQGNISAKHSTLGGIEIVISFNLEP